MKETEHQPGYYVPLNCYPILSASTTYSVFKFLFLSLSQCIFLAYHSPLTSTELGPLKHVTIQSAGPQKTGGI